MAIEDDRLLAIFHVGSEGAVLVGGQADEGRLAQRHRPRRLAPSVHMWPLRAWRRLLGSVGRDCVGATATWSSGLSGHPE